jgi:hypothetical protein
MGNQELHSINPNVADALVAAARLADVAGGFRIVANERNRDLVITLQRALVMLGFSTARSTGLADGAAVIDGVFGDGTARGVRQFQREVGLEVTGVVDAHTLEALDQAVTAQLASMDATERLYQRDVLDRTVRITPADLKRLYRAAITDVARAVPVREDVMAAILSVESAGGSFHRPKFEAQDFVALQDMRDALVGEPVETACSHEVAALARRVSSLPIRPGENDVTTRLGRSLVDTMARSPRTGTLRAALTTIRDWTARDLRELATSWGWGQIMGWQTLGPHYAHAGITLAGLQSPHPARQIAMLGLAISVEPPWRAAAQEADQSGDYTHFVQAYDGAGRGTNKNAQYAAAMCQAEAEYRSA